jgi:hypothetical protein
VRFSSSMSLFGHTTRAFTISVRHLLMVSDDVQTFLSFAGVHILLENLTVLSEPGTRWIGETAGGRAGPNRAGRPHLLKTTGCCGCSISTTWRTGRTRKRSGGAARLSWVENRPRGWSMPPPERRSKALDPP